MSEFPEITAETAEDNPTLRLAMRLAEHTGANIFLTGKAGTGKTTFLRNLVKRSRKRIVVAAPTGIAAVNAHGVTLHSLLQLSFGPYLPGCRQEVQKFSKRKLALLRSMDMLVIDEVSMVRSDLLDYVDDVLRRVRNPLKPFGGVQLLLIGDLQQLPPVVKEAEWQMLREHYRSPYFFHSRALAQAGYISLELEKVYRQDDREFIGLLNNIRNGHELQRTIEILNERYKPDFVPDKVKPWVRLSTHNASAHQINEAEMAALHTQPHIYSATVEKNFPENSYPAEEHLELKVGAQVMFLKNDTERHEYFNGMIGEVVALGEHDVTVQVPERDQPIVVGKVIWENTSYDVDATTGEMHEKVEGTFAQIPLRAAWAITIHKSQGLTFSHAIIDASASFAHGQVYVALSRCRNLEGLVLSAPLNPRTVIIDPTVDNFLASGRLTRPDGTTVSRLEREYVCSLLDSLFMADGLQRDFDGFYRVAEEAFHTTYPVLMSRYSTMSRDFAELCRVSHSFSRQYRGIIGSDTVPLSESSVQARIQAAAKYFHNAYKSLWQLLSDTPRVHDSAQTQKRLRTRRDPLRQALVLTISMLKYLAENPFATADFMQKRAQIIMALENPASLTDDIKRVKNAAPASDDSDIKNPGLMQKLTKWRAAVAKEEKKSAFQVFSTKALISISNLMPVTRSELLQCKGVGGVLADRYGDKVLAIVRNFKKFGA